MSDTNATQLAEELDKNIKDVAKKLFEDGATLGELKGITSRELNAVYQMGLGFYNTGRYDDAEKSGDEKAIAEAKERLAGAQAEVTALDKEIAQHDANLSALDNEVAACGDNLTSLLAKLDYPALVLVLAAITVTANDVTPDEARKTDEEAGQKKIPTPLEVLRESLEKAVKDIREEIVEKRIATV